MKLAPFDCTVQESNGKITGLTPQTVIELQQIKTHTEIMLLNPKSTEPVPCARGILYGTDHTLIHGQHMLPGYMKVSVKHVLPRYESVLFPIPDKDFEINTLKEAVGAFIPWPVLRMSLLNKKEGETKSNTGELQKKNDENVDPSNKQMDISAAPISKQVVVTNQPITNLQKKKKQDALTQLIILENDIPDRPIVQEVYTRWMTREDPTSVCKLNTPPGMFAGITSNLVTTIDVDDIMTFWKNGWLDCSIIFSFMMGLHNFMKIAFTKPYGLINPYSIQDNLIESGKNDVIDYLKTAFKSTYDYFFAPYVQKGHWVLFFVSLKENKGIILDSLNRKQQKTINNYLLADCINQARGPLKWEVVKCNQQPGSWEYGYYVLSWMYSIASGGIKREFRIDELSWDERCLSTIDLDDIFERWHLWSPF
ncbi:uncharacterized protein [Rutidosis leptorrhynchoides]|uniref:uncharacterized protein n=1 Tax=Rutidosis leptorrhynchoides TaxID=125765 RepID=UPI003A98F9E0